MWPHKAASLLLLLLWISSTRTQEVAEKTRPRQCGRWMQHCEWFCGRDLPFVNRTATGAFRTEFMRPVAYRPITDINRKVHPIFHIPGLESWRCLELSVHCSASRYGPNSSDAVYNEFHPGPMLQLAFRCQHFLVWYVAFYQGSDHCYEVRLAHHSHPVKGKPSRCTHSFTRPFQLIGDGHTYFLILFCVDYVLDEHGSDLAYWLFVNKRNTPEQNQAIVHRLSTGPQPYLVTPNVPFVETEGLDTEKDPPVHASACRCSVFEWYIRAVRRCQKPFVVPGQSSNHIGVLYNNPFSLPSEIRVGSLTVDKQSQPGDERLRWFVIKCLVISAGLGLVFYAVLLQLEKQTEESLSQNTLFH